MSVHLARRTASLALLASCALASPLAAQPPVRAARAARPVAERPFGPLRAQAARQQGWLAERMRTVLPALMRRHGVDMWVVPMREYNE